MEVMLLWGERYWTLPRWLVFLLLVLVLVGLGEAVHLAADWLVKAGQPPAHSLAGGMA